MGRDFTKWVKPEVTINIRDKTSLHLRPHIETDVVDGELFIWLHKVRVKINREEDNGQSSND